MNFHISLNKAALSRSKEPKIFKSPSFSVLSRSGLPKNVQGGQGTGRDGGRAARRAGYHNSCGNFFSLFFFLEPGLKLDKNRLRMAQRSEMCSVRCLFWGGCHFPRLILIIRCGLSLT